MLNFNNVPFTFSAQVALVSVCYHATTSVIDKEYVNALGKYYATLYRTYGAREYWQVMGKVRNEIMHDCKKFDFLESCFEETAKNL